MVRPDATVPMLWDIGFLLVGALLLAGGVLLVRSDRAPTRATLTD
jgi:uncharacterized membrane protein